MQPPKFDYQILITAFIKCEELRLFVFSIFQPNARHKARRLFAVALNAVVYARHGRELMG